MPNARVSKALAVLLVWAMMAAAFLVAATASAEPSFEAAPSAGAPTGSPIVSLADDPATSSDGAPLDLMNKVAPELQEIAFAPKAEYVSVIIHTVDVPALGAALKSIGAMQTHTVDGQVRSVPYYAPRWGAVGQPTSLVVQVPAKALADLAALPFVAYIDAPGVARTTDVRDEIYMEERQGFLSYVERLKAGVKDDPMQTKGVKPGVSPTSWGIATEHKAYDAWQIDLGGGTYAMGGGVNVAVVDTGEDFGHPSLQGQWAVAPPGNAWAGWPIMFHPASMEGLFGAGWWTAESDLDRLPLPYWLSANDGDSWYTNTDYVANDSDLDGYIRFADGTPDPFTGAFQRTPRLNPQGYGSTCAGGSQARISRNYYVGLDNETWQIRSASGAYHLGVNRDDTLTGLNCGKVGVLLVDSTTPYLYDTVYVDLNYDFNFTNDKPVSQADPISVADLTGDGVDDISGGLLYYIAQTTPVVGQVVVGTLDGTEMTADLWKWFDLDSDGTAESTSATVDVNGWFSFIPPSRLYLDSGALTYYMPSVSEDIYEEYASPAGFNDTGFGWSLGGPDTSFGPVNMLSGEPTPTLTLLQGTPDFAMHYITGYGSYFYDIEMCDASGACVLLTEGPDYTLDPETGVVTFWLLNVGGDIPDGSYVYAIYQLETYTLEPVSGTISFLDAMPAGWSLLADYEYGLPIPYSNVYGPSHGYETFIPGNGDMVIFHGEFDNGQSHGSFVSSTVAARPFGNLASTNFEVFGTAPDAKIIGIAACCNTAGPINLFGSIEDQRTFAAVGYDGVPGTGDEAQIMSNSFGDPGDLSVGFSFEDRWLIDYWNRWPGTTPLVALGNNGPGYATASPGGSSPGVIGVGAGTSGDYRILYGFDGGDAYWAVPDCSAAGSPPDPRLCTGVSSPFGPGPYGDHIYFSSRGPTLLGSPKPDIVSVGGYGVEAGPLNVFGGVPGDLEGNFAFDIFSGTSQATPVTAGVAALVAQAYEAAHGAYPTNAVLKSLLKSGADDMNRDIFQQGAGWTNALRSVKSALDTAGYIGTGDGVTSDTDYWIPGSYQGVRRVGFVNFLPGGSSDTTRITVTNRNPGLAKFVQVSDAVYQLATPAYRWAFTLATGTGQFYILRPTGPYGPAGVYASNGTWLLQAMPFDTYWSAPGGFVKATFTYDMAAYTGSTSWRIDTFAWYDGNADGVYGGFGERNRMTVSVAGAGANSIWDTIHSPGARIQDGWVLNPRSGAGAPIPATLVVEFYEKADWAWVTTSAATLNIPSLQSRSFDVTATPPVGAQAGFYEGAVYLTDGAMSTTIPIVINVPSAGFPVLMGGNMPTTSLYDVNGAVQGSRGGWRQVGDSRYVWADIGTVVSAPGRKMIYNAIGESIASSPEMFVFSLVADPLWTNDTIYGPGTMSLLLATDENPSATDTLYPSREFMHGTPISGFIAFQVKWWSALAETEKVEANIGIMEVTPISFNIVTNKLYGSVPMGVWANVPLYDGLGAAVTESATNSWSQNNIAANPDYAVGGFDDWMLSQTPPNSFTIAPVGNVISWSVDAHITSPSPSDDHDLQIWQDGDGDGVPTPGGGDVWLCQSAGATADERCTGTTIDGTRPIFIQVGIYAPGSDTFSISVVETVLRLGVSPFYLVGPTTTVPPYTPVAAGIGWDMVGSTQPQTIIGKLFVSPGYAPYALAIETSITWTYDLTPPAVDRSRDLSPVPNSVISNPTASVVANVADSAAQINRSSAQLIVDGVDVTSTCRILTPYTNGYPLLTIAWEHGDKPFTDGPHSAIVNVKDVAGNMLTEVWMWTVDTTGPNLRILSPSGDTLTSQATIAFEAMTDPGATVTVTANGAAQTATVSPDGRITATIALGSDGTYVILVTSEDALGNRASASVMVTRDSTSPAIVAGIDVLSPTNHLTATISGTVDESVEVLRVNGVAAAVAADGTFQAVVPLVEGSNSIVVEAWDGAGNVRTVTLGPIERDTIAPVIDLEPLPAIITDIATAQVTVEGTATPGGLFFVTINGQPTTPDSGTGAFSEVFDLNVGDNTFVVVARDDAGNVAQAVASVAYAPVVRNERANYNAVIASSVAVVLLIVGFVVGYLLSSRGGEREAPPPPTPPEAPKKEEPMAEEELPPEEPKKTEEEEL